MMIALLVHKHICKLCRCFLWLNRCHIFGLVYRHLWRHHLRFLPIWCPFGLRRSACCWTTIAALRCNCWLALASGKRELRATILQNRIGRHGEVYHLKLRYWVCHILIFDWRIIKQSCWTTLVKSVLLCMTTELNLRWLVLLLLMRWIMLVSSLIRLRTILIARVVMFGWRLRSHTSTREVGLCITTDILGVDEFSFLWETLWLL